MRHIKQGDNATLVHCLNVGMLCFLFGLWLGWSKNDINMLVVAGVCHDIGKIRVPHEILYKPGKLTNEEFDEVKKHTVYGHQLLNKSDIPAEVRQTALMHHEKLDGGGYPFGKTNGAIDMYAAVVAICDVYEAMTSDRVYRAKVSPFEVIRKFEAGDFGALRNDYIHIFTRKIADGFVNSRVLLSDDREGRIVAVQPHDLANPLIYCDATQDFIDLSRNKSISILSVM